MSYVFEINVSIPDADVETFLVSSPSVDNLFLALEGMDFGVNGVVQTTPDRVHFFLPGEANKLRLKLMEISS